MFWQNASLYDGAPSPRKEHHHDQLSTCRCVSEEDSAPKQRKLKKGSSSKKNMHNKDLGRKGEEAAARYLVRRGYDIVERNWTCIAGEADIGIASMQDTIVFVEVKTRTSAANGGLPGEAVTKEKRARYEEIACLYLEHSEVTDVPVRFDVVAHTLSDPTAFIRHHIDAFGVGW